ncbi:MAG: RNA polymerase sigma-I factor [Bacillota bacterium]|nr:RNA polymerase sigma-I factor [Bacillota bacterium]MDW7684647.1 RNA polymerase sigma-I factor [Bacillota bacterium]
MVLPVANRGEPIPEELLRKAQLGDKQSRELILTTFQPQAIRIASRCCGRFLHEGIDEEISIALLALNEAIDNYDPEQGSSFYGFAGVVVKRRLIDYYRSNKSRLREIPFSDFEDNDSEEPSALNHLEQREAEKVFSYVQETRDRKDEIIYFTQLLARYNISLSQLVKCSPKHDAARKRALMSANIIIKNSELLQYFLRAGELPLKEMESLLPFSRKTLERQRKFIIALLLVYIEDLPHIREYLKGDDEA